MKNYVKTVLKTKEEWLDARKIGGSSAAAICGKSKWLTKTAVWEELALGIRKEDKSNERMIKGTKAEEHIRELFALDFQDRFKVIAPPKRGFWLFARKDKPYITLTPDGLLVDKITKEKGGLEIKYVALMRRTEINKWEQGLLPDQYYFQCLHYFIGKPDIDFVVLDAHLQFFFKNERTGTWDFDYAINKPYFIYRKDVENHIKYLEREETSFYEDFVETKKKPIKRRK